MSTSDYFKVDMGAIEEWANISKQTYEKIINNEELLVSLFKKLGENESWKGDDYDELSKKLESSKQETNQLLQSYQNYVSRVVQSASDVYNSQFTNL